MARFWFVAPLILLLSPLALAQNAMTARRDPRAVAVLTQSLLVGGEVTAVRDFRGTGTITYYWVQETQGSVTVRGRGTNRFRIDAALPDGMRSVIVGKSGSFIKKMDGTTQSVSGFGTANACTAPLPWAQLVAAAQDPLADISYLGFVKRHGRDVYDIGIEIGNASKADSLGMLSKHVKQHYFIDPSTFLVLSVFDWVGPSVSADSRLSHEIQFSDYRTVSGVLIPFSIREWVHGQRLSKMDLSEVLLNTDVPDADFTP